MPYTDHDGTRIHYKVEGSGPPLILQHGMFWDLEGWERWGYANSLKRDFQLILVDARGLVAATNRMIPRPIRSPITWRTY